ncbi:hypothetical protein AUJ46_05950 [Candidatus Peregrinibacteria bacterium CG1_02_54_53]|nr:MAG: hypothetical protein AUJ46_05950 [Candidatus Peregrinibacteria bacterium CG1_02_54_53]
MDLQTFSAEIEKLTALPKEQVARAKEAAQKLHDADRQEFLTQLAQSDQELAGTLAQQSQAVEQMEMSLADAEKQMNRLERSSQESKEKTEEIKEAEKGIADISNAA